MNNVRSRIGAIPIVGYVLKVFHDIALLPLVRAHLLREIRTVELHSVPRHELGTEVDALEQRVTCQIRDVQRSAVDRRELEDLEQRLTTAVMDQLAETSESVQEIRSLAQHSSALAASARRAKREHDELARELAIA